MFWKKNKNEVSFTSNCGSVPYEPKPASNFVPDWFKNQSAYTNNPSKTKVWDFGTVNAIFLGTIKRCFPVRDAMTAGYIIPFPFDIAIKCILDEETGEPVVAVSTGMGYTVEVHSKKQLNEHPYWKKNWAPKQAYKFQNPWLIKTPPGTSCMFVHPQHQGIDKWEIMPGVVDTDSYFSNIQFPALFKVIPGDEFIIKGGTPMCQVIPFQRQEWTHKVSQELSTEEESESKMSESKIKGTMGRNRYRTWFHSRKEYK